MNWNAVKAVGIALAVAGVISVVSWLLGDRHGRKAVLDGATDQSDTIVKVVTKYKDFPDPVASASVGFIPIPKYMFLSDTVGVPVPVPGPTDTQYVYLPREQKYYEEDEGRLRFWVSGYDPRLDRYELDRIEKVVTNTVTIPKPKFVLEIEGGFGAMFPQKNVNYFPYIELEASYAVSKRWRIGLSGGYEAPITGGKITPYPYIKISGNFSILRL